MLPDHVLQHAMGLRLIGIAAHAPSAPGNLFPHQQPQRVAELQHEVRLLIVSEADEVGTHLLDLLHLAAYLLVGHRGTHASMVFVSMRSLQQQTAPVELERSVRLELECAEAKLSL